MSKRNNLFLYGTTVFLSAINLCLSKPVISKTILNNNNSNEDSVYRSHYAAKMLSFMNLTVNPCNDFYEYSCGNWKNVIEERMTKKKRNNILDIVYKLDDIVENILQRSHINDVAPEYATEFDMAKQFFNGCLKAKLYPMRASPEYLAVLKEIGGFPAVDEDWRSENFHWLNMSAHLSNYGINSFVREKITPQYPFAPYFDTPEFGFDIELHYDTIENSSSDAYKENEKRMRKILTIYGVETNNIDIIITEIFDFIKEILRVMQQFMENDTFCRFLSNILSETEITELTKKWLSYNDIAWVGNSFKMLKNCCTPCFFLYTKIDQICERNKRAAANYLSLKFLFHMDAHLQDTKFQKTYCVANIKSTMKFFFDHLYMKLYFSNELRKEISDMIKEIRQSLRIILQNANWMDETTRAAALRKESTIVEHIGRYENTNVSKILLEELKRLQYINGSYEANNLKFRKFKQYMMRFSYLNIARLSNITTPLDLFVGIQANSFYNNIDNSIYIMAGILMAPVYHKAWPNSLKYGTLGYVLGHEITHGFDTLGAYYDENGQKKFWWSTKSGNAFKERIGCYVDHYKSYLVPEINRNVNGIQTKDENIADGGGLREALMAYRRYIDKIGKDLDSISEEKMPGINLSPEQLFFLGFAQLWCASYKEINYWEELPKKHVIDKYRVLGALSNNADFAKAYSCPLGSNMNPKSIKCEVW